MQKLILKSDEAAEELELSFGLLMSHSKLSAEEKIQILLKQSNTNANLLYEHFKKNKKATFILVKSMDLD